MQAQDIIPYAAAAAAALLTIVSALTDPKNKKEDGSVNRRGRLLTTLAALVFIISVLSMYASQRRQVLATMQSHKEAAELAKKLDAANTAAQLAAAQASRNLERFTRFGIHAFFQWAPTNTHVDALAKSLEQIQLQHTATTQAANQSRPFPIQLGEGLKLSLVHDPSPPSPCLEIDLSDFTVLPDFTNALPTLAPFQSLLRELTDMPVSVAIFKTNTDILNATNVSGRLPDSAAITALGFTSELERTLRFYPALKCFVFYVHADEVPANKLRRTAAITTPQDMLNAHLITATRPFGEPEAMEGSLTWWPWCLQRPRIILFCDSEQVQASAVRPGIPPPNGPPTSRAVVLYESVIENLQHQLSPARLWHDTLSDIKNTRASAATTFKR